jgi:type IV pilus assembly protein PilA
MNLSAALRARRGEDERGFTLIELMVVVLIIAILIAIAIPTFLGAKSRAQDKSAQSSLRNALTNAKGIYTDSEDYANATAAALLAAEPSLSFVTPSTGPKEVSVTSPSASTFVAASRSKSGKCYAIADNINGPGTMFMLVANTGGTCSGAAAQGLDDATLITSPPAAAAGTVGKWSQSW